MTQEEIIKLANAAGFNWPDIQATTIEQRLERFASLVAATEREKFTNTQEFVTLPREVVEQALEAMTAAMGAGPYKHRCSDAEEALRAALEQPQGEQEPVATLHCTEECYVYARATDAGKRIRFEQPIDLYTHPQPKREPLTHYEIHELFRRSWDDCQDGDEIKAFARAIERAHDIK